MYSCIKMIASVYIVFLTGLFFTAFCSDNSETHAYRFWEKEIDNAITDRNDVFYTIIDDASTITITSWSKQQRDRALEIIQTSGEDVSVWHNFINGMLLYGNKNSAASNYFLSALSYASENPGTTWLLFVEFNRYNLPEFSEHALNQLEKLMLYSGAESVEIVSRQLLNYGREQQRKNDKKQASWLFMQSHRFNRNEAASIFQRMMMAFPYHFSDFLNATDDLIKTIASSWNIQLLLVTKMYVFIRTFFKIVVLMSVFVFCCNYIPEGLHEITHRYKESVSPLLRLILVTCLVGSFLFFGALPFFWLITFIMWKYCKRKDRLFYGIVMFVVACSPFDAMIYDRLLHAADPQESISALSRSLSEGPLYGTPGKNDFKKYPDILTEIVLSVKSANLQRARRLVRQLPANDNKNPLVDNIKGIAYYHAGKIDSAIFYYNKTLSYDRKNYCAQFNLARCLIVSGKVSEGVAFLKDAAEINPERVNGFIRKNDDHFGNNWPPLRQLIFPNYTPALFWNKLFLPFTGDRTSVGKQWGLSFFGIPPVPSLLIFMLFMVIMLFRHFSIASTEKPKHLFECKFCGRIICRKCMKGLLCESCSDSTLTLKSSVILDQARRKIAERVSTMRLLRNEIVNMFFPGAGMLLEKEPRYARAMTTFLFSGVVYAWWFVVVATLPTRLLTGLVIIPAIFVPVVFHLLSARRYVPTIIGCFNKARLLYSQRSE